MQRDLTYYPSDYMDARSRFLQAVRGFGAGVESGQWHIPGSRDDDLYTDYAYFPALERGRPRRLFVISSGVHGLEAYAGSAIQQMFLTEILGGLERRDTAVLMVHVMNPFGFKHHRRSTEKHVNLNRNCSLGSDLYNIRNPKSLELSRRFVPARPVNADTSFLVQNMRLQGKTVFFSDIRMDDFIKNVGMGQYELTEGFEFGGFEPEPQVLHLTKKLQELMPEFDDIVLFDLHTGLGERARLHLLTGDVEGCVHPDLFNELFSPIEDRQVYDYTPAEAEGFYKTYGALNNLFPEIAGPNQRVCALTLEFGTLGHSWEDLIDSLDRWLVEHQGCHYGFENKEIENRVLKRYLEKFYPSDPVWKPTVMSISREFFKRVMTRVTKNTPPR